MEIPSKLFSVFVRFYQENFNQILLIIPANQTSNI